MNSKQTIALVLCLASRITTWAQDQTLDKPLSDLTERLAAQVKEHGKKKVAVIDFTDLQGGSSELGRYIAEEMTVNLVSTNRDFSVLDRANLNSILAEHNLTAKGLVDPDNAKKLGQFAGVDALILGNIIQLDQNIELTAKVITTDTAEIVGAARTRFQANDTVQKLFSHPATGAESSGPAAEKKVIKSFGDLQIEMPPLRIVNGNSYELTLTLTNTGHRGSQWVSASTDMGSNIRAVLVDADGHESGTYWSQISGLAFSALQNGNVFRATEVPPHDSLTATVRFGSRQPAVAGTCRLQMELLLSSDFNGQYGQGTIRTLAAELTAH